MRYIVEVKTAGSTQLALMARRVARSPAAFGVAARCLVASFDAEFLRRMREADPEIATSFIFDHAVALPEPGKPTPLFPPVDAIGPRRDLVTPLLIAQAAAAGLSVHPWTADEEAEIRAADRRRGRLGHDERCPSSRSGARRRESGVASRAPGRDPILNSDSTPRPS